MRPRMFIHLTITRVFAALSPEWRKRVVRACDITVDDTTSRHYLPASMAHDIIYVQREYPNCASCHHPVFDGKAHSYEHCVEERQRLMPICLNDSRHGDKNSCATDNCTHEASGYTPLCACCISGLLDNSAKTAFLARFAQPDIDPVTMARAKRIVANAPLFSELIAGRHLDDLDREPIADEPDAYDEGGDNYPEYPEDVDAYNESDCFCGTPECDPVTHESYLDWQRKGSEGTWVV